MKKLKHAIYYDNRFGRNDGPPLYYWNVMKNKLKWDIVHLLPVGDTTKDAGPMDYHWWIDWGEDALGQTDFKIPNDGGKKIYVSSDTHLDDGYRLRKAKEFDYVFFNQQSAVKAYKGKSYWLPHAFEPQAYPNITTLKKYDVAFIGHMQLDAPNYNSMSRVRALDRLFRQFPNFYYGSRHPQFPTKNLFEDAAKRFSEARIVFNISIKDDINMRVFEAMGTGSFLLTNYLPTLGDLFKDGKHLVTYDSYDDMIDKAKYYLEHEKEREKIAEAGYKEVIKKHTYQNRIETIAKIIGIKYEK